MARLKREDERFTKKILARESLKKITKDVNNVILQDKEMDVIKRKFDLVFGKKAARMASSMPNSSMEISVRQSLPNVQVLQDKPMVTNERVSLQRQIQMEKF